MHDSMKESCRRRTARIYGSVHDSTKESCRTEDGEDMCIIARRKVDVLRTVRIYGSVHNSAKERCRTEDGKDIVCMITRRKVAVLMMART